MAERREEEGRKGGAMEGALPRYYEPTVTAVTDMVVPATRVQWGPVIAGVILALAVAFWFISLGVAIGIRATGLVYWSVVFAALGLFLGSLLTARTAKAGLFASIEHSIIVWGIVLLLNVMAVLGTLRLFAVTGTTTTGPAVSAATFGWSFFVGFLILLAASILGGLVGMVVPEEHVEHEHAEHT